MKRLIPGIAVLLLFSVLTLDATAARKSIVLNYHDFGPPAMSKDLLGVEWYQWKPSGSSNPKDRYNVKIVVYHGVSLAAIKNKYRIVKTRGKEQDYRYIKYKSAVSHLDRHIKENVLDYITADLKKTRSRIVRALGK